MKQKIIPHGIFCVYSDPRKRRLFTKSLITPAKSYFGERIVKEGSEEFREWDPKRSKLAASIMKGSSNVGIREGSWVLYLGSSHGFTPSFVSDMIGKEGVLFALEFGPEVMRDMVFISETRNNIVPILGDANQPKTYKDKVSQVDVVFQDVAQKNQVEIFIKNCEMFLKDGGMGLLAVKARSINIKKRSKDIFEEVRSEIEKHYIITDFRDLSPHEKDHCMIIIKKKKPQETYTSKKAQAPKFDSNKRPERRRGKGNFRNNNRNSRSGGRRR